MRPDTRPPGGYIAAAASTDYDDQPISRTYQYRKVMKPMLERKRRARINRCLDELKELMVSALQAEGENVSKLEKADILELTVRHLHKLRRHHALVVPAAGSGYADRFRAGFTHCATEVSQYLASAMQAPEPVIDPTSGVKLLQHLGTCIRQIDTETLPRRPDDESLYTTPPSSPSTHILAAHPESSSAVWRPW
ncbi:enhancer of split mbeta protein [Nilaparvata lugens]|uniref:enhancer of split mbeta protein n=1 Tax=Nilaparvata lugens TaxID=108931 RepID=UPI000B98BEFB|nr:enhancer of split mbeta protein [Nilaparvata lugens]